MGDLPECHNFRIPHSLYNTTPGQDRELSAVRFNERFVQKLYETTIDCLLLWLNEMMSHAADLEND